MNSKRIYLSAPHMSGLEQQFLDQAFATNWIAPLGPNVDAFEKEVAELTGVKASLALSSGTAAIHLALKALGVKRGDKVFCSSLTFSASANPIIYEGAVPVFIDSEPESWNMSPTALKKAFTESASSGELPKAVVAVNLYGQSADYDPIMELCDYYKVPVIEDAAESLGATYKGRASGTIGRFGIFSFNGNKIITTAGGGMLISDDEQAIEKARFWSTQARDAARHYQHSEIGYNYRMSNILAGLGRGQLMVLADRVQKRREAFARYYNELSALKGFQFMPEAAFGLTTRWLTALTVDPSVCGVTHNDIIDALAADNVEARPVWKPLHLQPVFSNYKYYCHSEGHDVAADLFGKGICLPSGSNMAEDDQERIITIIKNCYYKQ